MAHGSRDLDSALGAGRLAISGRFRCGLGGVSTSGRWISTGVVAAMSPRMSSWVSTGMPASRAWESSTGSGKATAIALDGRGRRAASGRGAAGSRGAAVIAIVVVFGVRVISRGARHCCFVESVD